MAILTHAAYALAYTVAGLSVGAALPYVRPGTDPLAGWLAGAVTVVGGALLHETLTRLGRERAAARRVDGLHRAVEELAAEVARQRDAQRDAMEEARRGGGLANYDTVVQEVKLLQSLVSRLTETRRPAERSPAAASVQPLRQAPASPPVPSQAPSLALAPSLDDAGVLEAVRDALRADRIDIYLQPVVSLPQRKHRFYEVFSRVRAVDGALIMPDRYLAIAEREGLIATIDNLLLVRCVQLIRETERRQHAIVFFSNISPATLSDADFMTQFLHLMAQNQALVPKLVFELGQADLRAGGAVTMGILSQLSRLGFRFSMDQVTDLNIDVPTLLRHEFRYIKLDRALALDPASAGRIADLRRALEGEPIDIIVEKIETEDQLAGILDTGFDFGQGYLFGEPRPSRKPS